MVFVIYSSQHVTGKQQYRNNVSLTGGITRIIDCLELTNEDFFFMRYDCVITRYFDI